jgi:hypothetical protein
MELLHRKSKIIVHVFGVFYAVMSPVDRESDGVGCSFLQRISSADRLRNLGPRRLTIAIPRPKIGIHDDKMLACARVFRLR